jgi:hypothetical protein
MIDRSYIFFENIQQRFAGLAIALVLGAVTFSLSFKYWSGGFQGTTDIIGYPIFANFNNYAFLNAYFLSLIVGLVLLAVIVYTCNGYEWRKLPFFSVFNLLTSIIITAAIMMSSGRPFVPTVVIVYLCQYFLNSVILFRSSSSSVNRFRETRESVLFSLILLIIPLALYIISGLTGWKEASGQLTNLIWFSNKILIAAELGLVYFIYRLWQQNVSVHFAKQQAISYFIIPALIFLLTASLQGTFILGDDFHTGEKLAPLTLGLKGALPWRDFLFVHGIWDDFLKLFLGAKLWELSLRAGLEAHGLLFSPLYWISLYLLFLKVFKDSYLKALLGLVISYALVPDPFRFPLYPFVLIFLYQAFVSSRKIWFSLFCLSAVVQIFISPEFGLMAFGLGCAIIANDIFQYRSDVKKFQRTLVCAITSLVAVTLTLLAFHYYDLLDGFLITIVHFSRKHLETGGIPIQDIGHVVWVVAFPIFFIACVAYMMISRIRLQQSFTPLLYLFFGLANCVTIYFIKYIGRPDGHIFHTIAVAVPGIALLMVHFIGIGIGQTPRKFPLLFRRIIYVFILLALMRFGIPGFAATNWIAGVQSNLVNLKSRFNVPSASVGGDVWFPGFAVSAATLSKAKKLQEFFANRLQPEDTVFDFSDSPTLSYAVLQLKPASRFVHVSMAIRIESQKLLIDDLKRNQPKYIIYQSAGGLNGWDGIPNEVRHYLVAAYINRHYVFDQKLEGALIFRKADIAVNDSVVNSPNKSLTTPPELSECRLGYVPNFFMPKEQVNFLPASLSKPLGSRRTIEIKGWVAALTTDSLPEILIVKNGVTLRKFKPDTVRPDVDKAYGQSFGLTGFSQRFDVETDDGQFDIQLVDQRTNKISKFGEDGWLGNIDSNDNFLSSLAFELDTGPTPIYLKLKFDDLPNYEDQTIIIESKDYPGLKISFNKLVGVNELVLPLGGCYVWSLISKRQPVIAFPNNLNLESAFFSNTKDGGL